MKLSDRIQFDSLKVQVLTSPKKRSEAKVFGFWRGAPFGVGETGQGNEKGYVWHAGEPAEITVPGLKEVILHDAFGERACGSCAGRGGYPNAVLIIGGDAPRFQSLHPKGCEKSLVRRCDATRQLGTAHTPFQPGRVFGRATLWSSTADSAVSLCGSNPKEATEGKGLDDEIQVGDYGDPSRRHAALWRGSSESFVDLNPEQGLLSMAEGAGDGEQVGGWMPKKGRAKEMRPCLWRGTAQSFVDLTPAGCLWGRATDCARALQVGLLSDDKTERLSRAVLWGGAADDRLDLHSVLPEEFTSSWATRMTIDANLLRIGGEAEIIEGDCKRGSQAVVWEIALRG